jgi:hypothetical protein
VFEYLDEVGIASMQWPARSQDLNPIENIRVWHMMGRRVRALQPPPAALGELVEQIVAIWENQDQADLLFNINSMGRRCEAAIHARDGNTRYGRKNLHSIIRLKAVTIFLFFFIIEYILFFL